MSDRRTTYALVALVLLSLIWGYNWVVMKKVLAYVGPFAFSALRTVLGALALFAVLLLRGQSLRLRAPGQTFLLGMLQTAAFTALIQVALISGGAGKTAVLVYAMPFWLLPMAWIVLGERVRGGQWLAVALAVAGLVFIFEPWGPQASLVSSLLALGGSACWAASAVLAKRMRQRTQLDLLSLTAWQMLFGALALCILALLVTEKPILPAAYFFGALAFNALAATGLAWLLWLFVLDTLPAAMAGLSSLAVPVVGVLAAWVQLGERPNGAEAAGMVLLGAALCLVSLLALRRQRQALQAAALKT
jgi:drug/metabolite transporter (DMT)-like permease